MTGQSLSPKADNHGALFDHPVRANEDGLRELEAHRLGCFQIQDRLDSGRLLDRQIARPRAGLARFGGRIYC